MKNEIQNNKQEISITKIVYFIMLLILIGLTILYISGTFNSPVVKSVNNSTKVDHNHDSADLSDLNEIKYLEEKVKNNPDDLNALLNLSHKLNDSGFYDRAIVSYEKYLKKDPKNVDVIIDMGVCYYQLRDYDVAIRTMEKGISLNPKHQIAYFNLGIITFAKGDHDGAVKYWKKAVEINSISNIGIKAKNLLDNH